ncbi:MAG: hypothetical protein ACK5RC_13565 [Curvibacter sp.]|jgi:hypothetical protein|nr:hypothetical protein [Curvibacter sp.]
MHPLTHHALFGAHISNALGQRESGGNYSAENTFNYLGKYQMGEAALQDTGYVNGDGKPLKNDYSGFWTGKDEVQVKKIF